MTAEYLDKYASVIVKNLLCLEKNDLLSLNTEERDMDFARIVADKALEVTENVVKLVVTENGKVQDVIDFEPSFPCMSSAGAAGSSGSAGAAGATGSAGSAGASGSAGAAGASGSAGATGSAGHGMSFAMLHLAHVEKKVIQEGVLLDTLVEKDDFPALQKLGHLADPQIPGRRISVPFCVVPVYESGDVREDELISKLDSDLDSAVLSCSYRSQFLHQADVHLFDVSGSSCSFSFDVPEDSFFPCGRVVLPNGRKYVPSLDFDKVIIPVCKDSLCGSFSAEFEVFGRHKEGVFVFENGKLVSYPNYGELERLFEYDCNLMKPGFIKASDKCFEIFLGGGCVECIDPSVEVLPSDFNECPYCLRLVLPGNLNAFFTDCSGKKTEIIRKGFFLE